MPKIKKIPAYGLSYTQNGLYFLNKLNPDSSYYNIYRIYKITGDLAIKKLEQAIKRLAARHDAFRTNFREIDGRPVQIIFPDSIQAIQRYDLEGVSSPEKAEEEKRIISKITQAPFDLESGSLFKFAVIERGSGAKTNGNEFIFIIAAHHIVCDDESIKIILKELAQIYNALATGKKPGLKKPELQYRDYAAFEVSDEHQGSIRDQENFWSDQVESLPPRLVLPVDKIGMDSGANRGSTETVVLDKKMSGKIEDFSRQSGISLFDFFLSVFGILFYRVSGQNEFVIGVPASTRSLPETANMIGTFVNALPIRLRIKVNDNLISLSKRTGKELAACLSNRDYPLEKIIGKIDQRRDEPIFRDLFNVFFQMQTGAGDGIKLQGIEMKRLPYDEARATAQYDLKISIINSNDGIYINLNYACRLFSKNVVSSILRTVENITSQILQDPLMKISQLELVSALEKEKLLHKFNNTGYEHKKSKDLIRLFESQAKKTSDKTAIIDDKRRMSYGELDREVNNLAALLYKNDVKPGSVVPVFLERSKDYAVSIMAILKAGAAFLPLDTDMPRERIEHMLGDSKARLMLVDGNSSEKIKFKGKKILVGNGYPSCSGQSKSRPRIKANDPAYLIYTSGTSGKPKGVLVSHGNLINYHYWFTRAAGMTANDRSLVISSFAYDALYTQFFGCLLSGGELHIVPKETYLQAEKLLQYINNNKITFLKVTPSLLNVYVNSAGFSRINLDKLRLIVVGGEEANAEDILRIHKLHPRMKIMNHYGPTEATIGCVAGAVDFKRLDDSGSRITIGHPIDNTRAYILDTNMKLLPANIPGELYIGGNGVGLGYWNNKKMTAEKFIKDPFRKSGRMYRTGDRARWSDGGEIEFFGRIDDQIKIRGLRVEPKEVEAILTNHRAVRQAVVIPRIMKKNRSVLFAYVVLKGKADLTEIKNFLRNSLPEQMIPDYIVPLESLPLTRHNKIDRQALPEPDHDSIYKTDYFPPATDTEKELAKIWQTVLGIEKTGRNDNFFNIGGQSLKAIQVQSRINKLYKISLPLKEIFQFSRLSELAECIDGKIIENNIRLFA